MKKSNFTVIEISSLIGELEGISSENGEKVYLKGILNEKLSMSDKFHLTSLYKALKTEKTTIDELRNEMIKKLGVEKEGNLTINPFLEDGVTENPNFKEFQKEFSELLTTEKTIEFKEFNLSSLDKLETEHYYPVFLSKIVSEENNPPN